MFSIRKTEPSMGSSHSGPFYVAMSKPVTKALHMSLHVAS